MDNQSASDFPLPQVVSSLRPYIKTRQEALRVRRALTVYLSSSLAGSDDEDKLPYALAAPDVSLSVKRIPSEISGLRKQYLKALQANEKARKEYQSLSDLRSTLDEANTRPISKKVDEDDEDHDGLFQTYLALLRLRRRYEKLQIFQDYLQLLCQKAPAKPQFLDMTEMLKELPPPPKLPTEAIQTAGANAPDSPTSDVGTLMRHLETSVLGAKHSLENERRLLAEWKSKRDGVEAATGSHRTHALGSVRNELICWIESELSKAGNSLEGDVKQASGERTMDPDSVTSEPVEVILRQYREYVEARKSLLTALSMATLLLPTQEKGGTAGAYAADEISPAGTTDYMVPAYLLLPFFSHHLLPLSAFQKSIIQQKSCLTTGLAKQQRSMIQAIERLGEESHLLPAYPLLAGQARFRNAAAVLASRAVDNRPVSLEGGIAESGGDDCIKKARAWAFAADTARIVNEDAIREKFESGETRIDSAHQTLAKLLKILGQTVGSDGADEDGCVEDDGADIWTTAAVSTSKRRADRNTEKPRYHEMKDKDGGSGLWGGLDGELGIIGIGV
ncbi:MAG: hypothetical protein M1839_002685 [Geoglossum umbratile]|nr:MAG: hypothetical protein M1839_002685 [Geoglossum umbratile]